MTRFVVIVGFMVAFAAGLTIGARWHRDESPATTRPSRHGGWLSSELNLTPAQREQLDRIWSETASRGGRDWEERRRRLSRERDEAIAALFRPEDKVRYDQVLKRYENAVNNLDKEWRASFHASVERTKAILTPEQQIRYDELLRRHQTEKGPGGPRGRDMNRRGDRRPSSQPTTRP